MGRHALPPAVAQYPHVGVAKRHFCPLPLPDTDQAQREPDHRRVAVDPHREVVLNGRHHLLVELRGQRQLPGFVTPAAIVVGGRELVSQQARVDPILEILGGVAIAAVMIFGIWLLRGNLITGGEIAGVLGGVLFLAPKLRALGTMNNVIQEMMASLSRIYAVSDLRTRISEPDQPLHLDQLLYHQDSNQHSFYHTY